MTEPFRTDTSIKPRHTDKYLNDEIELYYDHLGNPFQHMLSLFHDCGPIEDELVEAYLQGLSTKSNQNLLNERAAGQPIVRRIMDTLTKRRWYVDHAAVVKQSLISNDAPEEPDPFIFPPVVKVNTIKPEREPGEPYPPPDYHVIIIENFDNPSYGDMQVEVYYVTGTIYTPGDDWRSFALRSYTGPTIEISDYREPLVPTYYYKARNKVKEKYSEWSWAVRRPPTYFP